MRKTDLGSLTERLHARERTDGMSTDFHSCWSALPTAIRCRIEQAGDRSIDAGDRIGRVADVLRVAMAA